MRPITHYRDLTLRYLRQQKKRSILTALGILLSVALMFSSSVMGETLKGAFLQNIKDQMGNYHVAYQNVTGAQVRMLQANAKVEQVGFKNTVGYQTDPKGTALLVTGADTGYLDVFNLHLKEGRLPQADGEIALEQWYVDNMAARPKLGERIKLSIDPNMGASDPNHPLPKKEIEVVLTGIFKNKTNTQQSGLGYGAVTLDYAKELRGPNEATEDAAVRFKPHLALQKAIKETADSLKIGESQVHPNTSLLTALGQSGNSSNNNAITVAEAIVVGIILLATVAVIYNAFHISVVERIRQFGVLRSIGMTPRQIRTVVFGEATLLAAVAIPLGLVAGWTAINMVLAVFSRIGGTMFGSLKMESPWYIAAGTIALGLATVYLSAFGPAWSAGRVSPIHAIFHQNGFNKERTAKRKRTILSASFGITGRMAFDNLKRNRRRYRITLFSMCIGIVLYIFFSSFMSFITLSQSRVFAKDYGLVQGDMTAAPQFSVNDYNRVAHIPGVQTVYRVMTERMEIFIPKTKQTEALQKAYGQSNSQSTFSMPAEVRGYPPEDFKLSRPRLIEGSMDAEAMNNEIGVVIAQRSEGRSGTITVSDYHVGDFIELDSTSDPQKTIRLKVLGILDKTPLTYGGPEQFTVITTEQVFGLITGISDHYSRFDLTVDRKSDPAGVKNQLQSIADTVHSARVLDFVNNSDRSTNLMISILLYGLVAVISLISAINIVNTISTNLILRTREFGTLRAIGMTMKQMRRMIIYESIGYGLMATLYGGVAGVLLSRWLFTQMHYVEEIPYHFPWMTLLISGLAAIFVSLFASRIPLRRIARMDVVEAVRAEE